MEANTTLEFLFTKSKECFIRLNTQAPSEDAEAFAEIFLYCCLAQHALRAGGKENADVLLQLMNHGRDLDRLLNENPNDYYKLVDREGPRVHKTLAAKLHFDLLKLEKFKTSFKPVVVWRETLWEESILLLQRFLIRKHQGDDSHLSKLARAISLTGQAYHEGLLWRPSIPLRVAHSAAKENLDAMFRMHLKGVGLSDEEIDMRFAMTEFEEELDAAHADDGIIAAANKALSELDPNQDD